MEGVECWSTTDQTNRVAHCTHTIKPLALHMCRLLYPLYKTFFISSTCEGLFTRDEDMTWIDCFRLSRLSSAMTGQRPFRSILVRLWTLVGSYNIYVRITSRERHSRTNTSWYISVTSLIYKYYFYILFKAACLIKLSYIEIKAM